VGKAPARPLCEERRVEARVLGPVERIVAAELAAPRALLGREGGNRAVGAAKLDRPLLGQHAERALDLLAVLAPARADEVLDRAGHGHHVARMARALRETQNRERIGAAGNVGRHLREIDEVDAVERREDRGPERGGARRVGWRGRPEHRRAIVRHAEIGKARDPEVPFADDDEGKDERKLARAGVAHGYAEGLAPERRQEHVIERREPGRRLKRGRRGLGSRHEIEEPSRVLDTLGAIDGRALRPL
jgi:hypothetical protein